MQDIYLEWGTDLSAGSNGDLALVDGTILTNQRVLRRLLTNAGDYIWNMTYGGGLGLFVGSATNTAEIEAVIRTQISLEDTVPTTPAPTVTVQTLDSGNGYVVANINYADPASGEPVVLNVLAG